MFSLRPSFHLKYLASQFLYSRSALSVLSSRNFSTNVEETKFQFDVFEDKIDEEEIAAREAEIEKKRNVSKLYDKEFNRQHDRVPVTEPYFERHNSLGYKRRMYGKYGESSNVEPRLLWPSKEEISALKEYESVSQPYTVQELIARVKEKKELEAKNRAEEEAKVMEKVRNVRKEILEFHKRVHAKKMEALKLQEKNNKLVEEIRRHFGYDIDVRDERFRAMMAEKEMAERKAYKEAKRAQKELKMKEKMEKFKKLAEEAEEKSEEEK